MSEGDLTGRRRYRKTLCGFVVEVEYAHFVVTDAPYGHWQCKWRKARRNDLLDAPTIMNKDKLD